MQLCGSGPCSRTYHEPRIQKIRALVGVKDSWIDDLHRFAVNSCQVVFVEVLKLPYELQQSLGHCQRFCKWQRHKDKGVKETRIQNPPKESFGQERNKSKM